jgi:hypothetical protein
VANKSRLFSVLLLSATWLPAQAVTVTFYTDLAAWEAAVAASPLNLGVSSFETTAGNVATANGGTAIGAGQRDVVLGSSASFASGDTGLAWSFTVSTFEANAEIVYNDATATAYELLFTDVLSIGDFNTHDNDNFTVEITSGPTLYGFGLNVVNNTGGGTEWFEVFGSMADTGAAPYDDNNPVPSFGLTGLPSTDNPFVDIPFIGVVSDTPFAWLEINDDNSSNDIGISGLRFAGIVPVPLPGAIWLLLGPLALLGLNNRRETRNRVN